MSFLNSPVKIFAIGAVCVILGFLLPFLMVLGVIKSSLWLSFLTYFLQIGGVILGFISTAGMALKRRNKKNEERKANERDADQSETTGWME